LIVGLQFIDARDEPNVQKIERDQTLCASRADSAEVYVLCTGYRSPKSIDARLLNPKYVFKDMGSVPDAGDGEAGEKVKRALVLSTVLKGMMKRKRHREGHADGALTLYSRISALDFFRSPRPVALMCKASAFSIDPKDVESEADEAACAVEKEMPETTLEVLSCYQDLKVLARREFKLLLKWRMAARAALAVGNLLGVNESPGDPDAKDVGKKVQEQIAIVQRSDDDGESAAGSGNDSGSGTECDREKLLTRSSRASELNPNQKRNERNGNQIAFAMLYSAKLI
jgi:AdoMet-dependent rRNA methyltransferase SPB1